MVTRYIKGAGGLDYGSGWYLKAAQYLAGSKEGFASPHKREFRDARFSGAEAPAAEYLFVTLERADAAARERIRCAFVSTDSRVHQLHRPGRAGGRAVAFLFTRYVALSAPLT